MFATFNAYKNMIVASIIVILILGLYFYIHSLKTQIINLQISLKDSQVEVANYKLQSTRLKNALDSQNKMIEAIRLDKQQALKKLAEWKALPPKIKYKTITKVREVKSNECEDIKAQLDAIKHIDFNSL